jgi:hypothetical protein
LTGPVRIRGAAPGDVLEVHMLDLQPGELGFTVLGPGRGLLPDEFSEPFLKIWAFGMASMQSCAQASACPSSRSWASWGLPRLNQASTQQCRRDALAAIWTSGK